jgi:cell pole-organizing protein PopZ
MPKAGQAQDQAMDEILASIRRIIQDEDVRKSGVRAALGRASGEQAGTATDVGQPAPGQAGKDAAGGPAAIAAAAANLPADRQTDKDNVVELPMTQPVEPTDPVDEKTSEPPPRREPPVRRPVEMRAAPPAAGHAPPPRPLMSPRSDAAVANAFQQLTTKMLAGSTRNMEELVEEMLRPMLRNWLDTNMPPLVERLVREEIERVSRGRR